MRLDEYYSQHGEKISFSRQQASDFAKRIAGDFNPLHDSDAKLFCVPGDLLFAVGLAKYGLSQKMCFIFSGMVGENDTLIFPESIAEKLSISDENEKKYLSIEREGEISTDKELIENLTRNYVEFSGHTFPDLLVPLMSENGVMINPARPLVIYERMAIELERLNIINPELEMVESKLDLKGKKGNVCLMFCLKESGVVVGKGKKLMSLRGLRAYDQALVDQMVDSYVAHKQEHQ